MKDVQTGNITCASTDSGGNQANGHVYAPSISADGRYVAFTSVATNLVPGDTNGTYDVIVKDLQTGSVTLVSTDSAGERANDMSSGAAISADGRYVAFESNATNLVSGDTNGTRDVFVKDLQTGFITRASTDSSGNQANGNVHPFNKLAISADGRYVAFASTATNLVPGDTNGTYDVFVKDLQTGSTTRVSTDSPGNQGNGQSFDPVISADGRYVAFNSEASNLVPGDTHGNDVFVKDVQTGIVTQANTGSGARRSGDAYPDAPSISADGRFVAFASIATYFVPGDTNGMYDIFVKDLQTGITARVSTDSSGIQANNSSFVPGLSADGGYVTFKSYASNLVPGDTNGCEDVFRVLNPLALASVVSVTPSVATVTDNNVGMAGFSVRVTYDKPMNTNRNPVFTFSPDVSATLTYDPAWNWWVSNTTFQARFDVVDANVNTPNVGIDVTGALDADGNLQTPYNGTNNFSIDTLDPAPAPPAVLSAAPSVATVTDNNVGTAAFAVRIAYNQAMNTNTTPAITFTPNVAGTLTYNPAQSWWVSNTTFVARYDVADTDAVVSNISIGVTSAYDATGNVQTPYSGASAFSIDTLNPAAHSAAVTSATPNLALVTDNQVGTATFAVRIVYNAAMNTNINPVVTFAPDVSTTLTYDRAWSWWVSNTAFVARYDVADANVAVAERQHPGGVGPGRHGQRPGALQRRARLQHRHAQPAAGGPAAGHCGTTFKVVLHRRGPQQRGAGPQRRHPGRTHKPTVHRQPGRSGPAVQRHVAGRVRVQGSGFRGQGSRSRERPVRSESLWIFRKSARLYTTYCGSCSVESTIACMR